jgi:Ca-activated chloride channel homolog
MFSAGAAMGVKYQLAGAMAVILVPSLVAATEARVEVDANLVTALDISHSVGRYEEWVEREGLAQAVTHPRFIEAVRTGFHGQIGFAILIWSSHGHMKTLVPWTTIATPEDAMRVSQRLRSIHLIEESQLLDRDIPTDHYEAPKEQHQTDIALAIHSASALLKAAPSKSRRSVINIVGNGPSNSGMEPTQARDAALEAGQVVNGLVVSYGSTSDVGYYRTHVIGGPGSFVMQVSNLEEMTEAFLAKFRMDIAGLSKVPSFNQWLLTAERIPDQPNQ